MQILVKIEAQIYYITSLITNYYIHLFLKYRVPGKKLCPEVPASVPFPYFLNKQTFYGQTLFFYVIIVKSYYFHLKGEL